ncbi:MAG: virulence RhuM family protein [Capsulimonas sp.]|uniref:virulence RhuM family protein n=1 Tax=Capsulimonas sp. TaxID=2494211 RepID=UPI003265265B
MTNAKTSEGDNNHSEFLIYQTADGQSRVQVRVLDETVWLTQRQMAELFEKDVRTVNEHIQNIFSEGELTRDSTNRKYRIVQMEGNRSIERDVDHYDLDVIISVGYRVHSHRGTQFRQWATQRLREFIIKGFLLDDDRLKEATKLGADYFDELLERIRDIRTSERRFYQKITDIYATSIDYDPAHSATQEFFATVQNKLHWAIHGHTAAELIAERANASQPNMGLTHWKNGPAGKIRKADIEIAKNYLTEEELTQLNLLVDQYLSFAELQARSRKSMTMSDWRTKLDAFLNLNDRAILEDAGAITKELAKDTAAQEFAKYESDRRRLEAAQPTSDFDQFLEQIAELPQETKEP